MERILQQRGATVGSRSMSRSAGAKHDWSLDAASGAIVMVSILLAIGAGIAGFFVGRDTKHPRAATPAATQQAAQAVDPHVAAGAHLFVQFAGAQCHGPQ